MQPRALTVTQLLAALNGQVAIVERLGDVDGSMISVTEVSTSVVSARLFVAVKGERVDGHTCVGKAIKAGAAAIVGQDSVERASVPFVRVTDSHKALSLIGSCF